MKTLALTFILVTFCAFAHEEDCSDPRHEVLPELEQIERYLWNGANAQQIANAPCKTKTPPGINELTEFINTLPNGSSQEYIHGVNFSGEKPELLRAFRRLTTSRDHFGTREVPSAQVNIQGDYQINPTCTKVLCAVEKIWGPQMGPKILLAELKFKVSTSELSVDVATRYTPEELDDVLMTLSDVPKELRNWPRNFQPLIHYEHGALPSFHTDIKTRADSLVTLYDRWSIMPSKSRQYVIFHEIAHNFSLKLGDLDNSTKWLETAGWEKYGANWVKTANNCAVSGYGQTDPDEDFAETVTTYRYNGNYLRQACPAKYQYMKDVVFKGREYLNSNCSTDP